MEALVIEQSKTGPVLSELPSPVLADAEVLVDVTASSVNAIDLRIAEVTIEGTPALRAADRPRPGRVGKGRLPSISPNGLLTESFVRGTLNGVPR